MRPSLAWVRGPTPQLVCAEPTTHAVDCTGLNVDEGGHYPRFAATASRTSATKASSSSSSPLKMSSARRVPASGLALKVPDGSSRDAPLAKVTFTLSL